jgi:hypothetical protein
VLERARYHPDDPPAVTVLALPHSQDATKYRAVGLSQPTFVLCGAGIVSDADDAQRDPTRGAATAGTVYRVNLEDEGAEGSELRDALCSLLLDETIYKARLWPPRLQVTRGERERPCLVVTLSLAVGEPVVLTVDYHEGQAARLLVPYRSTKGNDQLMDNGFSPRIRVTRLCDMLRR